MKTLYKILLFFAIFQMMAIVTAALNIFPKGSTLYSDIDLETLASKDNPVDVLSYMFVPNSNAYFNKFTIGAIVVSIVTVGGAVAFFTGTFTPVVITIIGLALIPMLVRSQSFFSRLFSIGNSQALIYLGLCLGVGFIIIAAITLIELPAQGDS